MAPGTKLMVAVRLELGFLWDDLYMATTRAIRGTWSMECDSLEARIKALTRLGGPTPWGKIQLPLLESGVYQRIHADLGIPVDVDMAKVAQTRQRIGERRSR